MNWFTENKIFSSFLVLIALGILALGYLTFAEKSKFEEARETYQSEVGKLTGLRALAPYRDTPNLKKYESQVASYKEATEAMQGELLQRQGTIASIEPAVFQGRLREAVSKTVANANQRGVELPAKFYLGFERYENELPRNDVAGLLNWQLTAVQAVIDGLINLKVSKIEKLTRPELPGELTSEAPAKETPLLKKFPFEVVFTGYPGSAQALLNQLDSMSPFLIARTVRIANEQLKSPARPGSGTSPAETTAPVEAAVDKIIIGKEKISTTVIIDLVQFTPGKIANKK